MAKLPRPPSPTALASVPPALLILPAQATLGRIFRASGEYPASWNAFRYWGPTNGNRFDHQLPGPDGKGCTQDRGILYAAARVEHGPAPVRPENLLAVCVAEVFQKARVVETGRDMPTFALFEITRPLTLLDLTGYWPTQAGASQAISSGPRPRAQTWAQAIYAAYPEVEGLLYRASMGGGEPALALFERGRDALPSHPLVHRRLDDPALRDRIVQAALKAGYALL